MRKKAEFSFTDEELAVAAGAFCEAKLNTLPKPEECKHEFSPGFERKMEKLFARERAMRKMREVRRWAAAILLLVLIGGGAVLVVDTEARASLVEWVRTVYNDKIVYRFFNESKGEVLPVYELGWVPEGYELVDEYRDNTLHIVEYQKRDISDSFIYQYGYMHKRTIVELLGEQSEYEIKTILLEDKIVDVYIPTDTSESNIAIWIDAQLEVYFMVNGFLEESVMLHIFEGINLE